MSKCNPIKHSVTRTKRAPGVVVVDRVVAFVLQATRIPRREYVRSQQHLTRIFDVVAAEEALDTLVVVLLQTNDTVLYQFPSRPLEVRLFARSYCSKSLSCVQCDGKTHDGNNLVISDTSL